ncbi:lysozyme [Orenia marismortui]|uniref:Lysozyme n=2 Tax=Orenia marismortui TaxID=46469 RepID=A0A4R8GTY9_9FIRM|nr:lysozyme [Orenia marismortui]
MKSIEEQLIMHEGLEFKPYKCPAGKTTIGVGRNLEDRGITKEEAIYLLQNDIKSILNSLVEYDWFVNLDNVRKKVIIDMAFNMGVTGLLSFQNMIQAIREQDYQKAGEEMKNSRWYHQVNSRAKRLVKMMKTGKDY